MDEDEDLEKHYTEERKKEIEDAGKRFANCLCDELEKASKQISKNEQTKETSKVKNFVEEIVETEIDWLLGKVENVMNNEHLFLSEKLDRILYLSKMWEKLKSMDEPPQ